MEFYLQMVIMILPNVVSSRFENVRKDVAVINLSLLNTPGILNNGKRRPGDTKFINFPISK